MASDSIEGLTEDWPIWMELAQAIHQEGDPRPLWEQSLRRLRELAQLRRAVVVLRGPGGLQTIGHEGSDVAPWLEPLLAPTTAGVRRLDAATASPDEWSLLAALGCEHALWLPLELAGETVGGVLVGGGAPIAASLEPLLRGLVAVLADQRGRLSTDPRDHLSTDPRAPDLTSPTSTGEKLRQLALDHMADGVLLVDGQGRWRIANEAFEQLRGRDLPADQTPEVVFFEDDGVTQAAVDQTPVQRHLRGESVGPTLVRVRSRTEPVSERWMRLTVRTVHGPDGVADGALAVAHDITEQRLVEQRLRASEARWRMLASHAPDLILWLDGRGYIQYSNRGAWGRDAEGLSGRSVEELLPADSRLAWRAALDRALHAGQEASCEVCTSTSPAEGQWMSFLLGPVLEEERGVVVVGRDVSDKRHTEARLLVSDRMVAVGMLASGVAHEINNPLTAIATNLELAQTELARLGPGAGTELSEMLSDAYQAAGRVQAIVRDLKIFSRAEEERVRPTDLREVLETTVRLAWNEIRHRAKLVRDYQAVGLVAGNEARLGQVFLNLIMNAAQAIPEGNAAQNEIRLRLRPARIGHVEVSVEDTGVGMTAEVKRRLFTPFFTTKPVGVGTGLGLSVCRRIIESHQGEIVIESEPGRGTTVRVLLPLSVSPALPLVTRPPPAPVRRGKVLILDDEPVITTAVRRILGTLHEVSVFHYGGDVLEALARGERYDLLFCDLMMPEMTGMDFYELLAQRWPEQAERVVFLTGGAFTTKAREFLDQVSNLRLDKPFSAKVLRTLVADHLSGQAPTLKT